MSDNFENEASMIGEEDSSLSGLVICCAAVSSLLVGMGITSMLTSTLGVAPTCAVVLAIFLSPILWTISRRREAKAGETPDSVQRKEPRGSTSMDRTWVISFWCVCSLVLLMIANLA